MAGRIPRWNPPGLVDGLLMFPTPGSDAGAGRAWPARRLDSGKPVRAWIPPFGKLADPVYRARWLRQAAAARELSHPYLLPLEAVGGTPDRLYLQEAEPGVPTLADELRQSGALEVREAVLASLHTARALAFLHAQGFSHGRVDAEHLVRDPSGLTRLIGVAREGSPPPLGTGAPGATLPVLPDPDAVKLDLIGLGDTLLALLTGPDISPEKIKRRLENLPRPLVALIESLQGSPKAHPAIQNASESVAQLESVLSVPTAEPYLPREDLASALREAQADLHRPRELKWKRWATTGFFGGLLALAALSLMLGLPRTAIGWLSLAGLGGLARLAVAGVTRGDDRWYGLAAFLFGGTAADRLSALAGLLLVLTGAAAMGLFGVLLAFLVVAAILAVAEYAFLDRPIQEHRTQVANTANQLLRSLRNLGLHELQIRRVIQAHADPAATGLYPELFGPDSARMVRKTLQHTQTLAQKLRGPFLSDRLMDSLQRRLDQRRDLHLASLIQSVEEQRLESQGVNLLTARRRSRRIATAICARLASLRATKGFVEHFPTPILLAVLQAAEAPELVLLEHGPEAEEAQVPFISRLAERLSLAADSILGPRTRFLLGSLLLAGFLAWVSQNQLWAGKNSQPADPPPFAGQQ